MTVTIRQAHEEDAERLNAALAQLSTHLGDTHRVDADTLRRAGWGAHPVFRAALAEIRGEVIGAELYWPVFSTGRGGPGVFVSDLWVARALRGTGLGRRLLIHAMRDGAKVWGAGFLKLTVAQDNGNARDAYSRLGFRAAEGDRNMIIDASALTGTEKQT